MKKIFREYVGDESPLISLKRIDQIQHQIARRVYFGIMGAADCDRFRNTSPGTVSAEISVRNIRERLGDAIITFGEEDKCSDEWGFATAFYVGHRNENGQLNDSVSFFRIWLGQKFWEMKKFGAFPYYEFNELDLRVCDEKYSGNYYDRLAPGVVSGSSAYDREVSVVDKGLLSKILAD